jgi:hypothetical protein
LAARRIALVTSGITLAYLLIALLITYPLLFYCASHLPLGSEPAATVPLFNLWTLLWNAEQLPALYQAYWHAPIFFPTPGTFALSEPQPLSGLLFAPVFSASRNPVFAYNVLFWGHLTLNGLGAYTLVRGILGSRNTRRIPFVCGVLAQTLPFVTNEWGVLQLTALYPIWFTLAVLRAWAAVPTRRRAVTLALWVAAVFWTSLYYGLFLALFLGLWLLFGGWGRRHIASGVGAIALAALFLAPLIMAQGQYTQGYERSQRTIQNNSAEELDYRRLGMSAWGTHLPWLSQEGGSGQRLYPGTLLLALGGVGAVAGWRWQRRWVAYAGAGIAVAYILSLGLNFTVGELHPYEWIREFIPGFRQLRSPFRLALFVQIFLVTLTGIGLQAGASWLKRIPALPWQGVGMGLMLLGLLVGQSEVLVLPTRLYEMPPTTFDAAWMPWLRAQPAGAAVSVPFVTGSRASQYEATTLAMLASVQHHHPLVNGYSGFFPDRHDALKGRMSNFPSYTALTSLQAAGVRYVIADATWQGLEAMAAWTMVREVYRDELKVIYVLQSAGQ